MEKQNQQQSQQQFVAKPLDDAFLRNQTQTQQQQTQTQTQTQLQPRILTKIQPNFKKLGVYEENTKSPLYWSQIQLYTEMINQFSQIASQNKVLSKENYYDLYSLAVLLLKMVDGVDPDKLINRKDPNVTPQMTQQEIAHFQQTKNALLESHNLLKQSTIQQIPINIQQQQSQQQQQTTIGIQQQPIAIQKPTTPVNDEDSKSQKKRKRQISNTNRNLHCHMCGVTETPEWRRGPAGDHTLCNACGLHYAKSIKKQKKTRN